MTRVAGEGALAKQLSERIGEAGQDIALIVPDRDGFADEVERPLALARAAGEDAVLLALDEATLSPIGQAALLGALAPLAIELAPGKRVSAVVVDAGAELDDVVAALRYLAGAEATTGQWLRISPSRMPPGRA